MVPTWPRRAARSSSAGTSFGDDIGKVENIPGFIKKVKDKNSEVRLMGFGHRVYKNYDPRAKIMQKMCHAVLKETGHGDDPILDVASQLETIFLGQIRKQK